MCGQGWFIQYIERDPEVLARREAAEKRKKADLDEEQRQNRMIEHQIEAAQAIRSESVG
jgi:DNA/RNA-binding protein KIN17